MGSVQFGLVVVSLSVWPECIDGLVFVDEDDQFAIFLVENFEDGHAGRDIVVQDAILTNLAE